MSSLRHVANSLLQSLEQPFDTHNRIEVSASALQHNLSMFRDLSDGMQIIPVLKANAYGHGLETVVRALRSEKLPYIAVDGYFEALAIRNVSSQPVLVMGAIKPSNFARMKFDNFAFVVQDIETVEALAATGKRIKVHVEVGTGMNRYGATPAALPGLVAKIVRSSTLELEGVMTHLADADGDSSETVEQAVRIFDEAVRAVRKAGANPSLIHVAQTAGSVIARSKYAHALRLGIGLYGINPYSAAHKRHGQLDGLRPALQLISTITKVNQLQKGDRVSYNYTFTAKGPMRIGVLPLGYYEGLSRALSSAGSVSRGEEQLPIVGRVCMNHTMIDLRNTELQTGDEVVVYSSTPGAANSIDVIAAKHGLFNYNLLTALNPSVRRILID